jgi:hypothetical protein
MNIIRYTGDPENPTVTVVGTLTWDAPTRQLSYNTRDVELAEILRAILQRGAVPHKVWLPPPSEDGCCMGIHYAGMDDPKFLEYLEDWLGGHGFSLAELEHHKSTSLRGHLKGPS